MKIITFLSIAFLLLTMKSAFSAADVVKIQGPLPDTQGITSSIAQTMVIPLEAPAGQAGSLSFWFKTDQPYRAGLTAVIVERPILAVPGLFALTFRHETAHTSLIWRWEGIGRGDVSLNAQLPGLPGSAWIHFAANWDADAGIFDVFLNGTPLRAPGTRLATWAPGEGSEILLHLGGFALTKPIIMTTLISEEELRRQVTLLYWGSLDGILGARPRGTLNSAEIKGEPIYRNPLARAGDIARWVLEGPGIIKFEDGWMRMLSERPDGPDGHLVLWHPDDLPDSFVAEWEMQLLKDDGLCIVFIAARGRNGEDIFDPSLRQRTGIFGQYTRGDIDTYHISFYANSPVMEPGRMTSNMRRNHGFYLVDNGPIGIPPGSRDIHTITVVKNGPRVQLAVDGRLVIDFIDDGIQFGPRLREGKLGFRQMQWTDARYRNLRIYKLR